MERISIPEGITFDDVLLVPQRSELTPDQADVSTQLTRRIRLELPLISAPMDTVTESALAIALSQEGGIGFIHKNLAPAARMLVKLGDNLKNQLDIGIVKGDKCFMFICHCSTCI